MVSLRSGCCSYPACVCAKSSSAVGECRYGASTAVLARLQDRQKSDYAQRASHIALNYKNAAVGTRCCSLFENLLERYYQLCCNNDNVSGSGGVGKSWRSGRKMECARFQPNIEHSSSRLKCALRAARQPAHLLQLVHTCVDQGVDRGLCSRALNRQILPIALTIIDYGSLVQS